jgi:hypothetical protein
MEAALIFIRAAVSVPYLRKGPLTPLGFHLILPVMIVTTFLTRPKLLKVSQDTKFRTDKFLI